MGTAVLSLVSSIVGGLLVLAGQYLARRAEDRRHWLTRFQEAAGDYATSFLEEGARVNDARRAGKLGKMDVEVSTYVVDRQKAIGRFMTLPWAPMFDQQRGAMGNGIERLWATWDATDEEFQAAYKASRRAVHEFTSAVGEMVRHPDQRR
ncbi:MAG: hypothetical protein ACRDRX_07950 [Pseudonocardiaceae bacterium]